MKVLIIDNYDSFTFNLFQLFGKISNVEIEVFRNDEITISEIIDRNFDAIILSPGPGNPENTRDFGICGQIIYELSNSIPILGVCLGHQGMGYVFGGQIIQANQILHGKVSKIKHNNEGIFANIPQNIHVARYHSLLINRATLPKEFSISAMTDQDEIMGIQHAKFPLFGVQFHPESFMTEYGLEIIKNFVNIAKLYNRKLVEAKL